MGKHAEWRKLAKKARRKCIRQQFARLRGEKEAEEIRKTENSPSHQCYLAEQAIKEDILEQENALKAKEREAEWMRVEVEAQRQFQELQKKLSQAREDRARQNEQIKAEWQKEQLIQKKAKEKEEQAQAQKLRQQELLNQKVQDFIDLGGDTPEHLKTLLETNPNKAVCPFFQKTSTCRFFDVCSRNHIRPGISRIILIPNFFSHYSLEKGEELGSDSGLEFETHETYQQFQEFFNDVIPELEQYGEIELFFTCCNHETHLRGNVFIEFSHTRAALKCYRGLNGRWYGGKQLSVQFAKINSWKSAICGLFNSRRCPKGNSCNFLHVFRNPRNSYSYYEENNHKQNNHRKSSQNWSWSDSPRSASHHQNSEWEDDVEERNHKLKSNSRSYRRPSRSKNNGNDSPTKSVSSTHHTYSRSSRSSKRMKRSRSKGSSSSRSSSRKKNVLLNKIV